MPLSWRWHLQYRQAAGALYQWAALLVFLLVAWWLCSVPPASAAEGAATATPACVPHVRSISVTKAADTATHQPPQQGWEPVTLPDNWKYRWPGYDGTVWYRIEWERNCTPRNDQASIAMTISAISMAGEVYSNQDLIWRDPQLQEPLSRSWNSPRYWVLPHSSLHATGINTVWVRVVGIAALSPGLGRLHLGGPEQLLSQFQDNLWNVRTSIMLNLSITAALGMLALFCWLPHRKHPVFGWYALVSVCWLWFGSNLLQTQTWPYPNNLVLTRFNHVAYIAYITSFVIFCWHLMGCPRPRWQSRTLLGLTAAISVAILAQGSWQGMPWAGHLYTLVFIANTLLVVRHAWRTRQMAHVLVATWLVLVLVIMARDILMIMGYIESLVIYAPYTSLLFMVMAALLIRQRVLDSALRIERFNQELSESVERACSDLSATLAQEHALALHNAHLQERLQLAQDLHDGLGGQIVRSIMLVEQSTTPPSKDRYLSMLKLLRDDLRQVVDNDGSIGATAPATPEEWTIPLRYRFVSLFDDLDMRSEWLAPQHWKVPPSALQCMLLARVAEEALTNTVKHSQARMVRVSLQYTDTHLVLRIADDGIGFDAHTALRAGLGIGMSSMRARMERMGGSLQVQSRPGATALEACLPWRTPAPDTPPLPERQPPASAPTPVPHNAPLEA